MAMSAMAEDQQVQREEYVEFAVEVEGRQDLHSYFSDPYAFLAKKIKAGRGEVNVRHLDEASQRLFHEARGKEVAQFLDRKAIKLLKRAGVPADRIMGMRFVQTWKSSGAAKARLVLQGFTDPDLLKLRSDAPTISKRGRMLFFLACSHFKLQAEKADVVGAFLQSDSTEELRNVFGEPPYELLEAMGCAHEFGKVLVQILKPVYGLSVAPRRWWQQICKDLSRLKWRQAVTEPCMWLKHVTNTDGVEELVAIMIVHVDDFLIAGDHKDPRFLRIRAELKKLYTWQDWETWSFDQTGSQVEQLRDWSFRIGQPNYADSVSSISVNRERR